MVTVILSHEAKDYAAWRTHFDAGESLRSQNGVKTTGVYTDAQHPNKITVITEFPSAEAVQGFLDNPQLKADMEKAGISSPPQISVLNRM